MLTEAALYNCPNQRTALPVPFCWFCKDLNILFSKTDKTGIFQNQHTGTRYKYGVILLLLLFPITISPPCIIRFYLQADLPVLKLFRDINSWHKNIFFCLRIKHMRLLHIKIQRNLLPYLCLIFPDLNELPGFCPAHQNRGSLPLPASRGLLQARLHLRCHFQFRVFSPLQVLDIFRTDSQDHVSAVISVCDLFSSGASR